MSSNTAASTPDTTPMRAFKPIGRAVTMPTRLASPSPAGSSTDIGSTDGVETLFTAPSANIIKFTATAPKSSSGTHSRSGAKDVSLPWFSATERPMAAGPLDIHRVPGSVSFLHSGAFLHAILPRSQCWCVDGEGKFVLRTVMPDTYYRIELPGATAEDLEVAESLKLTLAKVSSYERTPCPFGRAFSVEVPEEEPSKKKSRRRATEPVKKWKQHAYKWRREGEELETLDSEDSGGSAEQSDMEESDVQSRREVVVDGEAVRGVATPIETPTRPSRRVESWSVKSLPDESTDPTSPSRLGLDRYPRAVVRADAGEPSTPNPLDPSRLRTFQAIQAIPTDMPPSPPDSSADLDWNESLLAATASNNPSTEDRSNLAVEKIDETSTHSEAESDLPHQDHASGPKSDTLNSTTNDLQDTDDVEPRVAPTFAEDTRMGTSTASVTQVAEVVPEISAANEEHPVTEATMSEATDAPHTPTGQFRRGNHRSPEIEDQFAQIQARILARRSIGGSTTAFQPRTRYASSPSSNASTLASDKSSISRTSQRKMTAQHQALSAALANKACAVFLGPPAYLVAIMLRIAKRFTNGARNFATTYVLRQDSLQIPGSFQSDEELEEDDADDMTKTISFDDHEIADLKAWMDDDEDTDDFGLPLRSPIRIALEAKIGAHSMPLAKDAAVESPSDET